MHLTDTTSTPNGHQMAVVQTDLTLLQPSVAHFTKEVNPRLAKCPLKINGRLANLGLTSVVKEAAGGRKGLLFVSDKQCAACAPFFVSNRNFFAMSEGELWIK